MPITPKQFLQNIDNLVSLPDVCVKVNQLAEDPKTSAVDIAEVIALDPNLSAQILRIANSAYYGFPMRIETLSRAITVIGTQDLRDLVLSSSIINMFSGYKNQIFELKKYWRHSLLTAFLARELAGKTSTPILSKERLFVAGLLHDIGKLAMSVKIPEIMHIIKMRAEQGIEPYNEVEKLVFGLTHAEIGAELMHQWHLPKALQHVAKYHHQPGKSKEFILEASIVHIADAMAKYFKADVIDSSYPIKVSSVAWKVTGLDKNAVMSVIELAKSELENTMPVFVPERRVANF